MGIYSITSPDPTLADDISCIALSPAAIQNILTTALKYSLNWRFKFNAGKSCGLRFTPSPPHNDLPVTWFLGTESVYLSNTYNNQVFTFIQNFSILRKSQTPVEKDDKPILP